MKELNQLTKALSALETIISTSYRDEQIMASEARNRILDFIRANTMQPKRGKLNLFDWTGDKNKCLDCICYDDANNTVVATSGYVLITSKSLYKEFAIESTGEIGSGSNPRSAHLLKKDGSFRDGIFPEYTKVIPDIKNYEIGETLSRDELSEVLRSIKALTKTDKKISKDCYRIEFANGFYINVNTAKCLLQLPNWEFYFAKEKRSDKPILFQDDDITALAMPLYPKSKLTALNCNHLFI